MRWSLSAIALLLSACMMDAVDSSTPASGATSAIVGGARELGEPAVVVVKVFGALGICTGTLVSPRVVLTAKHCVQASGAERPYPPSAITVGFGDDATTTIDRRVIRVSTTPGAYTASGVGLSGALVGVDVAAITLLDPALGVEPIEVGRELPRVGEEFTAIGFGRRPDADSGLKYKTTSTVASLSGNVIGTANTICSGDSGGPAILEMPTRRVVGVASFGVADACPSARDGYNTVEPFLGLIDAAMIAAGDCPLVGDESCNSIDDDCDGTIDEGCKRLGEACATDDECAFAQLPERFAPLETPVFCGETAAGRACTRACDPRAPRTSCDTLAHPFDGGETAVADVYCARTDAGACGGLCARGATGTLENEAPCDADADCASSFCVDPGDGASRCLSPCEGGADLCAADEVCAASSGACGACVAPSLLASPRALGEPCASDAECIEGRCFEDASSRYCSRACASDADCGDAFHCRGATCARGPRSATGEPCVSDDDCNGGDACAPAGYCTHPCTVDELCPAGFSCRGGSCAPGASLVGERCEDDDECASGWCTSIGGRRACATPCGGEGRCGAGQLCLRTDDGASLACATSRPAPTGIGTPGGGGGCETARAPRDATFHLLSVLLVAALAAVRRGRARR